MRNTITRAVRPRSARPAGRGDASLARLADLLEHPRYEVLPTSGTADLVAEHLPAGRAVTVTSSPAKGLEVTVGAAVELAGRGYDVVPHLAARQVTDHAHLVDVVARLTAAGVERVFVPSGDGAPVGDYPDARALLVDLAALEAPLTSVGITGYPEPYAQVPDAVRVREMWDKRPFATEAVTNLAFDARAVGSWIGDLRRGGFPLPLWLGVPGPVDSARLLAVATRIGVGESTRFLLKNRRTVTRLLAPGGFSAEAFLRRLAPTIARHDAAVAGLHVFTFNQVAQTEAWRTGLLARLRAAGPTSTSTSTAQSAPHQDRGAP